MQTKMIFLIILSLTCANFVSSSCNQPNQYDYIVVGAGSTGGVVATRLSEDPNTQVLLLEAGVEPISSSEVPLTPFTTFRSEMDWNYYSVPQTNCCTVFKDNKLPYPRGKALGGTSSMNYMAYTRCSKKDYDSWAEQNAGWSFNEVLPYFIKLENAKLPLIEDGVEFGKEGPMSVELATFRTPLAQSFLDAAIELDEPLLAYNSKNHLGFFHLMITTKNGKRCSTWECYIKPIMNRTNLHVVTNALVTKILINDQKEAYGVQYERQNVKCEATANKEVIVSAGTFGSPQLLMLSGIGPKETLVKHRIPVIVDLPGVGQNFQDHIGLGSNVYTLRDKVSYHFGRYNTTGYINQWKETRTGPLTGSGSFEGIAFFQSTYQTEEDWPDMEIFFSSDSPFHYLKPYIKTFLVLAAPSDEAETMVLLPILLHPKSRGYVTLKSSDPHDHPIIQPNFLADPNDVDKLVEGLKMVDRIVNTHPFQKYGAHLANDILGVKIVPQCIQYQLNPKEFDRCVVRNFASSSAHPAGTCKMGPNSDPMAVVDNRLRVYGVNRLRVADASIMPNMPSGHPNAPCMMIGEKVSDMIKEDN